jgi:hypothetical protein
VVRVILRVGNRFASSSRLDSSAEDYYMVKIYGNLGDVEDVQLASSDDDSLIPLKRPKKSSAKIVATRSTHVLDEPCSPLIPARKSVVGEHEIESESTIIATGHAEGSCSEVVGIEHCSDGVDSLNTDPQGRLPGSDEETSIAIENNSEDRESSVSCRPAQISEVIEPYVPRPRGRPRGTFKNKGRGRPRVAERTAKKWYKYKRKAKALTKELEQKSTSEITGPNSNLHRLTDEAYVSDNWHSDDDIDQNSEPVSSRITGLSIIEKISSVHEDTFNEQPVVEANRTYVRPDWVAVALERDREQKAWTPTNSSTPVVAAAAVPGVKKVDDGYRSPVLQEELLKNVVDLKNASDRDIWNHAARDKLYFRDDDIDDWEPTGLEAIEHIEST